MALATDIVEQPKPQIRGARWRTATVPAVHQYISAEGIAAVLQVSVRHVRRMYAAAELPRSGFMRGLFS